MKKIILISCVSKKFEHKAKVKELYISTLFVKIYPSPKGRSVFKITVP